MCFFASRKGLYKYDLKSHEVIESIMNLFSISEPEKEGTFSIDATKVQADTHTRWDRQRLYSNCGRRRDYK